MCMNDFFFNNHPLSWGFLPFLLDLACIFNLFYTWKFCTRHDAAIKLHQMGLDRSTPDHGPIQKVKGVLGCNGNVKMVVKAGMNNSDNGTGPLQ